SQALQIAQQLKIIRDYYMQTGKGSYVDAEYAITENGDIVFTQTRPETAWSKGGMSLAAINKEEILEVVGSAKQIDTLLLDTAQEEWIHIYNQEEAQGALFDAGWTLAEGETIRSNEEGEKLSLRLVRRDFAADNSVREESLAGTAEVIKQQLEDVGIEVVIESYPNEVLQEVIANRDYDMILYGQNLGYNSDTFSFWHSSQATSNGLNLSNYQNPKADFVMESLRDTFDPAERENLLGELSKIISTDVPAVFLFSTSNYYLVDLKITGVNVENILHPKDRFSNIADWKLN
ncbi:MAG: ABC transporter substrate-binding protein, partial [Patescibacteria group bacterium]